MLLRVNTNSSSCRYLYRYLSKWRDVRSFTILLIEVALLCSNEIFFLSSRNVMLFYFTQIVFLTNWLSDKRGDRSTWPADAVIASLSAHIKMIFSFDRRRPKCSRFILMYRPSNAEQIVAFSWSWSCFLFIQQCVQEMNMGHEYKVLTSDIEVIFGFCVVQINWNTSLIGGHFPPFPTWALLIKQERRKSLMWNMFLF